MRDAGSQHRPVGSFLQLLQGGGAATVEPPPFAGGWKDPYLCCRGDQVRAFCGGREQQLGYLQVGGTNQALQGSLCV